MTIGQLLPSIVDLVHADSAGAVPGARWCLSPICGSRLDESMTLEQNDIHDGAQLMLTITEPQEPEWVVCDPSHTVVHVGRAEDSASRALQVLWCVLITLASAAALAWSATQTKTAAALIAAGGLAAAATLGVVIARRARAAPALCIALSVAAVIYAAVTGLLAVPAGAAAAHVLLASAAAFSVTLVLLRIMGCGAVGLTAIAVVTFLVATVAAATIAWQLRPDAAGAALATLSVVMVGAAPRFAIAVKGIAPSIPALDSQAAGDLESDTAEAAHDVLTGVIIGSSAATALGCCVIASAHLRHGMPVCVPVFLVIVAMVLLLRTRTHVDPARRAALSAGGIVCFTAAFTTCIAALPEQAIWLCIATAGCGVASMGRLAGLSIGPIMRRVIEYVEYAAIAAVVPMAFWVAGVYEYVRGMGLL